MVKRYNLNSPPAQTFAEMIAEMKERAQSSKTGAHGIKDMGETGDSVWTDPATGEVESTRNVVGKVSEVGIQIEEAKEAITEAEGVIADLKDVRLPALREDLEQAQQEASDSFAALDQKFNEVPTSEELEQVRTNLGAVLTTAQDAQAEAEQASANALAAAGIAADKGRVYYQSSAPTDDASKSVHNLWIDSDDGKVYVWNTATSSWKESESQSLRDAAQAALLAQQTADSAVAAAASAMAAAVEAQRTADQSTLDAADAFNAAIEARDRADAAQSRIAYGPNLVDDPSISKSSAYWSTSNGTSTTIEDRDMGRGVVTALKHVSAGHTTIYSPYFPIDPTMAYEYRITFDKPVVDLGRSSDFYFGISAVSPPPGVGSPVDGIYQSNGNYGSTNTNFYFWNGVGPFDGPREIVGYVLPRGTDNSVAQGLGNAALVARLAGDTDRLRMRFLNYANVDQELALYASNISVRAVPVEDLIRARDARQAAKDAQDRADAAMTEAEKKLDQSQVQAIADEAERLAKVAASADATAKAEQAEADAAVEAARIATEKANAAESNAALTAQQKATAAKEAAEATAKAQDELLEARAAADAKTKADKALADAKAALAAARTQITAEITASANGKNSITVSTAAPTTSTPGVVLGDTWWRVDGSGQIFGQWRWTGPTTKWVAATIRSEVIANLDVGKLTVTGSSRFTEAVIENLWVNSLVAKIATFQELTVATGNLLPNGNFSQGLELWRKEPWEVVPLSSPKSVGGNAQAVTYTGNTLGNTWEGPLFKMVGGERYVFECWIRADKPGSRFFFELRDETNTLVVTDGTILSGGSGSVSSYAMASYRVPIGWTNYRMEFTARAGTTAARPASLYFNHGHGTVQDAQVWLTGVKITPKKGVVHIANGQVGADEVNAESVGAAVGNFVKARVENLTVTAGATIPDAVIIKLAAEMITSGFFRTSDVGQRVQIDKDGLVMYGVGPDGEDTELVKIGPSGGNLITIGDSTVSPDGVRALQGTFDDLSVGGDSLTDRLNQFPRGIRAWGEITQNSVASAEVGVRQRRAELQTTVEPNRLYRIVVGPRYFEHNYTSATYVSDFILASYDATPIKPWVNPTGGFQAASGRHYLPNGTYYLMPALEAFINTSGQTGDRVFWAMYTMEAHHGSTYVNLKAGSNHSMLMYLEDIGPAQAGNLKRWNDGSGAVQDPTPIVTRTTKTWNAGGFGGDTRNGNVYQGTFNSRIGNRYGGWVFSSGMRSDLSGSTIEKFEVYLENYHWYYGSGGTARIVPNDGSYKGVGFGNTNVESKNWPRYAGRWVTIPSTWHSFIANGTYRGVSTYTTNTGLTYYGQMKGAPTKFRATYRK